jgi:hypothetical protein
MKNKILFGLNLFCGISLMIKMLFYDLNIIYYTICFILCLLNLIMAYKGYLDIKKDKK